MRDKVGRKRAPRAAMANSNNPGQFRVVAKKGMRWESKNIMNARGQRSDGHHSIPFPTTTRSPLLNDLPLMGPFAAGALDPRHGLTSCNGDVPAILPHVPMS